MYFSASSNGGNPSFYVEVYKYNGTTFTLLGSSATTPEGITNGTAIDIYYTSVGIPETVLTITDRLAIRVYVTHSGRTITLHTEDNHLSEIVTTFSNGLTALNGLTKQAQYFAVGSTGTDFNISSSVDTHTFNIPDASASARGLITTGAQTIAGDKTFTSASANPTVIIKNTGSGRKFEVHNSGGSPVFYVDLLGATYITDNLSISSGTFNMGQTMLATGASYFASNLNVTRTLSTNSYVIAFRTGATQTSSTPNWYAGNYSGNNDFEITNYAAGALQTSLKINSTTNLVTLLGGISATTATFTGLLTGATATFVNSGAGIGVGVTNSGSGDGIKITHSLGRAFNILSSSTGYGIIINNETASTSVPFTIQKQGSTVITMTDAGGATFGGAVGVTGQLSLGSTITNGTYTYTLPSATGTLALTSALSGYLPLSAGPSFPLTGALSGTSASFSNSIDIAKVSGADTVGGSIILNRNTSSAYRGGAIFSYYYAANAAGNQDTLSFGMSIDATSPATVGKVKMVLTEGGNVGIGTTSPDRPLDIYNASTIGIARIRANNTNGAALTIQNDENAQSLSIYAVGSAGFGVSGWAGNSLIESLTGIVYGAFNGNHIFQSGTSGRTERMRITSGGNVGIGVSPASANRFVVKGEGTTGSFNAISLQDSGATDLFYIRCDGYINSGLKSVSPYNFSTSGRSMVVDSAGGVGYLVSTKESKSNIESIKSVDFINQLNPVQFNYRKKDNITNAFTDEVYDNITYGFIADEVEKVNKELVFYNEDKTLAGVEYNNMIAILTKAIQEQQAQIEALKLLISK
jgi:hypothetical protein